MPIDFKSCREEIAGALQEFCNRWCKRDYVESNALNSWKLNIFKIIDGIISFYCINLDLLPPKPKFTFRHLKKGIQEFHRRFVLPPPRPPPLQIRLLTMLLWFEKDTILTP